MTAAGSAPSRSQWSRRWRSAFLVLPVVAIFARVPPGTLLDQLGSGVVRDALVVTLKTSAIAQALVVAVRDAARVAASRGGASAAAACS